jgi:hypothetical protein
MVKLENAQYHTVQKFVVAFLTLKATPELVNEWKDKANLQKLKNSLKKINKPCHPLRPKSEYIYFCEEVRPIIQSQMREEGLKVNIHKVTCELGQRWRQFKTCPDPEIKNRIAELAEKDRKRYHSEKEINFKKEDKKENHLKSKYLFFCKEEREKNPKITFETLSGLWALNRDDEKLDKRYRNAKLTTTL